MSRSGYSDDIECAALNLYRANVDRALCGKRGQAFLREMLEAMDAMPEKRLITSALVSSLGCCAMGAVAQKRGIDTAGVDETDAAYIGDMFGISRPMAAEIAYVNDEQYDPWNFSKGKLTRKDAETPEQRWVRVRAWVVGKYREDHE